MLWSTGGGLQGPAADSLSLHPSLATAHGTKICAYARTLVWLDRGLQIRGGVRIVPQPARAHVCFFRGWL